MIFPGSVGDAVTMQNIYMSFLKDCLSITEPNLKILIILLSIFFQKQPPEVFYKNRCS